MKQHLVFVHALSECATVSVPYYMKGKNIALWVLRSCGDQDSLSTFTEPRSLPEDITNVRVRFLLKFYGAVRSTSLDKLRYILYTRSVSRLSLSSGFKLESSPPTAAAAKFHSYRAYIAEQQFLAVTKQRWGVGTTLTIHNQSTATVANRKQWPTYSAAGYLITLAPRKTSSSSQRVQRHVPGGGNTLCEGHEIREEVQQWIGNNLCPTDWGWQYKDESLITLTADRPVAPKRGLRIVSCGCQTCCRKTCGCPKAGLYCSPMCSYCNGHICSNIHALAVSQYSDNEVWMR